MTLGASGHWLETRIGADATTKLAAAYGSIIALNPCYMNWNE